MIVVVDASTVIGAALKADSIPRQALLEVIYRHRLALSTPVFEEIYEVLTRPKFRKAIPLRDAEDALGILAIAASWMDPSERVEECRDPNDDIYLELALAAGAEVIVSSDRDLLSMDPWRGIRILTARTFLEKVGLAV